MDRAASSPSNSFFSAKSTAPLSEMLRVRPNTAFISTLRAEHEARGGGGGGRGAGGGKI